MKILKCFLLCLCIPLVFISGCTIPVNMHNVHKEPHFAGVVVDVYDNSILVSVNEGEEARKSSDLIDVSLNVELKDGVSEYMSGDEVIVYYNGTILENYPARLEKVYAILIENRDWTNVNVEYATYEPTASFGMGDGALLDGILRQRRGCIVVEIKDGSKADDGSDMFSDVLPFFPAGLTSWDEAKNILILNGTEYLLDSQVSFGGGYANILYTEEYIIPKWYGDPEKAFIVSNHGLPYDSQTQMLIEPATADPKIAPGMIPPDDPLGYWTPERANEAIGKPMPTN